MSEERERWTKLVEDFETSGLTQKGFAQERGVSYSTLRNWVYRLRRERGPLGSRIDTRGKVWRQGQQKEGLRFIPVEVVASAPYGAAKAETVGAIELVLSSGSRLRFSAGTEIEYLRALAAVL
jgi:transposase